MYLSLPKMAIPIWKLLLTTRNIILDVEEKINDLLYIVTAQWQLAFNLNRKSCRVWLKFEVLVQDKVLCIAEAEGPAGGKSGEDF